MQNFFFTNLGVLFGKLNQLVANPDFADDLIVYSQTWEQDTGQLPHLFEKLSQAKLYLVKSEFCQTNVIYLGHILGRGKVKPIKAKVEAIEKFPTPQTKKELQRFLGMAGYCRKFCPNFSDIACPLTNLLPNAKYIIMDRSDRKWF